MYQLTMLNVKSISCKDKSTENYSPTMRFPFNPTEHFNILKFTTLVLQPKILLFGFILAFTDADIPLRRWWKPKPR